jgi:hypothetical protein
MIMHRRDNKCDNESSVAAAGGAGDAAVGDAGGDAIYICICIYIYNCPQLAGQATLLSVMRDLFHRFHLVQVTI